MIFILTEILEVLIEDQGLFKPTCRAHWIIPNGADVIELYTGDYNIGSVYVYGSNIMIISHGKAQMDAMLCTNAAQEIIEDPATPMPEKEIKWVLAKLVELLYLSKSN